MDFSHNTIVFRNNISNMISVSFLNKILSVRIPKFSNFYLFNLFIINFYSKVKVWFQLCKFFNYHEISLICDTIKQNESELANINLKSHKMLLPLYFNLFYCHVTFSRNENSFFGCHFETKLFLIIRFGGCIHTWCKFRTEIPTDKYSKMNGSKWTPLCTNGTEK